MNELSLSPRFVHMHALSLRDSFSGYAGRYPLIFQGCHDIFGLLFFGRRKERSFADSNVWVYIKAFASFPDHILQNNIIFYYIHSNTRMAGHLEEPSEYPAFRRIVHSGHAADPDTLLFRAWIGEVPDVPRWVEVE